MTAFVSDDIDSNAFRFSLECIFPFSASYHRSTFLTIVLKLLFDFRTKHIYLDIAVNGSSDNIDSNGFCLSFLA